MTATAVRSRVARRPDLVALVPTALVGLTAAVPAAMHLVAVTAVAYTQRGGYDARLAQLLVVGGVALGSGLAVLGTLPALWRGERRALRRSAAGAAVFVLLSALLAPADPSFAIGLLLFGGYLALALVLGARVSTPRR